jgi:SAM-dependent methyltransferase
MSEPLHEAVHGFDRNAGAYEQGRPEYPEAIVDRLHRELRLRTGDRLLELGPGTGKLTRLLAGWPVQLLAAEPIPGMIAEFRRAVPAVALVRSRAEAIPVRSGRVHGVVAAQAFHWFRQPAALDEIARVLVPGGALGLVWNTRDESVPWVARLSAIIDAEVGATPRARSGTWRAAVRASEAFGPLDRWSVPFAPLTTPDQVIARVLSISAVGLAGPERRATVVRAVRGLLSDDPMTRGRDTFPFPYRSDVYITRRRSD